MIEAEIARLALGSRVILPGRVSERDLAPMLAHADAAVMLGLHEGFGLPALEAIACGTAVLASSTGALPEVVGDLGVLCDPFSVDAIRIGLDRIISDATLREHVWEQGPVWARSFTWESTANALVDACLEATTCWKVAS
jgi:glycosyltransferase involved in cell wall biosynthesis